MCFDLSMLSNFIFSAGIASAAGYLFVIWLIVQDWISCRNVLVRRPLPLRVRIGSGRRPP